MTPPKMRKSLEGPSWKNVKQKNTASNTTLQRCKTNAGSKWHHCAKVDSRTWQQANISPVQPREFIKFSSNDLTLENLKIACVEHFGYLVGLCDVLVPNKGPSCTKMNEIPHRKDKVSSSSHLLSELFSFIYLTFFHWVFRQVHYVRFVANLEQDERYQSLPMSAGTEQHHKPDKCAKFISEPVSPTKAAKVPPSCIQLQYQLSNCWMLENLSPEHDLLNKEWKQRKV